MLNIQEIKKYINKNYDIDFVIVIHQPNNYEKYEELEYRKNKKKYSLSCGWAYHYDNNNKYNCWSIYYDYMDYKEYYGYGGTYIDDGINTIDKIMNQWNFKKQCQLTLFDE